MATLGTVTFVYEGDADDVQLIGGLHQPLDRLPGTHLWPVALRVPELQRAVVSYALVPGGKMAGAVFRVWRGPSAPPRHEYRPNLLGRIIAGELAGQGYPRPRALTIYLPPKHDPTQRYPVVYMADGQSATEYAHIVEPLLGAELPAMILVGVHNAGDSDGRGAEYIPGFDPSQAGKKTVLRPENDQPFQQHRRFWVEQVLPWAEATYGATKLREHRAVFGFSLGIPPVDPRFAGAPPRHYLMAGTLEPGFHSGTSRYAADLRALGAECRFDEHVAGHDNSAWRIALLDALRWTFGAEEVEARAATE